MAKKKPAVSTGTGAKPVKHSAYPFDNLQKKGDWFGVADRTREGSLRSQASKQAKARKVVYKVQRVAKGVEPFNLKRDGVVVIFQAYVTE